MRRMKLFKILFLAGTLGCTPHCTSQPEWQVLFDGKSLAGWKASEHADSFQIEDGTIVCAGPRAHLYYVGDSGEVDFTNFEFTAEVMTTPGSNSGIFFHTAFQDEGWPSKGYEAQVLNSKRVPVEGSYMEHKMTGSLYGIRNLWKSPTPDEVWFTYRILVQGKTVRIWINDRLMVDYTEPTEPPRSSKSQEKRLSKGTFALQAHDPGSKVYFRNLRVRRLDDGLPSLGNPPLNLDLNRRLVELYEKNFPVLDLHVHLKKGLSLEEALSRARAYGFTYGIGVNCGLKMTVPDEASLKEFLATYEKPPETYLAMQAEGREWIDLFSEESIARFDYVITDAMTWTNDQGKRMRLWIPEEVEVGDPEDFMEMLVNRTEQILSKEPIDIFVNPTYLPKELASRYDQLWTPERMDRVIHALVANGIALEINDSRRLPSADFIKRAKAAGAKFTFGTNNAGSDDLRTLDYCLEMVKECDLRSSDIWIPQPKGSKGPSQ